MMRNDYRRALILLRSDARGYSGHVRLERRTLMGSMYFLIRSPQDAPALRAFLAGRSRRGEYACDLGELSRDGRGQAVLSVNFDPREICGRPLEDYQLIVISRADDPAGAILLRGNVDGHADLSPDSLRRALLSLRAPQETPTGEVGDARRDTESAPAEDAAAADEMRGAQGETQEARALPPDAFQSAQTLPEEAPAQVEEEALPEFMPAPEGGGAAELLNLDIDLPWPEAAESLRLLFIHTPPLENPPDDEFVYIAAPMPEESGYAYCAVGILARDGAPAALRYALPAQWSAQPPAGLEDYSWVGDGNRGWWMTELQL